VRECCEHVFDLLQNVGIFLRGHHEGNVRAGKCNKVQSASALGRTCVSRLNNISVFLSSANLRSARAANARQCHVGGAP
jgi:hypothetical protein